MSSLSPEEFATQVRRTERVAMVLFLASLVLLVTIALVHWAAVVDKDERASWERRYYHADLMLGRLHAFRLKSAGLFEGLVLDPISDFVRDDLALVYASDTGHASWRYSPRSSAHERELKDLMRRIERFGSQAEAIAHQVPDSATREDSLKRALVDNFPGTFHESFTTLRIASRMARLDDKDGWPLIAFWIMYGRWRGGEGNMPPPVDLTFRDLPWAASSLEYWRLLEDLDASPGRAEELLRSWRDNLYQSMRALRTRRPEVPVPVGGATVRAEHALLAAGPVLVFLQLLFLVCWAPGAAGSIQRAFIFPIFNAPNDPLRLPWSTDLDQLAQRIVWLLFLILPTGILALGAFTNYDLIRVVDSIQYNMVDMFRSRPQPRDFFGILPRNDLASVIIRLLNIGYFLVSTLILTSITGLRMPEPADADPRPVWWRRIFAWVIQNLSFGVGSLWIVGILWIIRSWPYTPPVGLFVFALFSFGCATTLAAALRQRSCLGTWIAALGLVGSLVPLMPS